MQNVFKVIKGGIKFGTDNATRRFISGHVTNTRLMGVIGMDLQWEFSSDKFSGLLNQIFYLDAEEYGLEAYTEAFGKNPDIIRIERSRLTASLGGSRVKINESEARFLLQTYVGISKRFKQQLPDGYDNYKFMLSPVLTLSREEYEFLFRKISGLKETPNFVINYYMMRTFASDFRGVEFLTARDSSAETFLESPITEKSENAQFTDITEISAAEYEINSQNFDNITEFKTNAEDEFSEASLETVDMPEGPPSKDSLKANELAKEKTFEVFSEDSVENGDMPETDASKGAPEVGDLVKGPLAKGAVEADSFTHCDSFSSNEESISPDYIPAGPFSDIHAGKPPAALCRNTIERAPGPIGNRYLCESLVEYNNSYRIVTSEIILSQHPMRVVSAKKCSSFKITSTEVALILNSHEFISVFDIISDDIGFLDAFHEFVESYTETEYECGKLYIDFFDTNNHVGRSEYLMNADVRTIYFLSDYNQLIIASYSAKRTHDATVQLTYEMLPHYMALRHKFEFSSPVLYEFLRSGVEDFFEFLNIFFGSDPV